MSKTRCPASERVLEYLKEELRSRGATYQELATWLGVSLSTVKRLLNTTSVSLETLERVAAFLGLGLGEVMRQAEDPAAMRSFTLTAEQEEKLARNWGHLAVFSRVMAGGSVQALVEGAGLSRADAWNYLRDLEKWGLVERLPGDRVLFPRGHWWHFRKDGAINARLLPKRIRAIYRHFRERPYQAAEDEPVRAGFMKRFFTVWLSREQSARLLADLEELAKRHLQLAAEPRRGEEYHPMTLAIYADEFDHFGEVIAEVPPYREPS